MFCRPAGKRSRFLFAKFLLLLRRPELTELSGPIWSLKTAFYVRSRSATSQSLGMLEIRPRRYRRLTHFLYSLFGSWPNWSSMIDSNKRSNSSGPSTGQRSCAFEGRLGSENNSASFAIASSSAGGSFSWGSSLSFTSPEIFESSRRELSRSHRVRDVSMPQPRLKSSGVMSLVRERITAAVPEHVSMGLKAQLGLDASALDHAGESSR
jgi:hypothetical protein